MTSETRVTIARQDSNSRYIRQEGFSAYLMYPYFQQALVLQQKTMEREIWTSRGTVGTTRHNTEMHGIITLIKAQHPQTVTFAFLIIPFAKLMIFRTCDLLIIVVFVFTHFSCYHGQGEIGKYIILLLLCITVSNKVQIVDGSFHGHYNLVWSL